MGVPIVGPILDTFTGAAFQSGNWLTICFSVIFLLSLCANIVSMILCPILANKKQRSIVGWLFIGLLIGWIGLIIIACLKPKQQ